MATKKARKAPAKAGADKPLEDAVREIKPFLALCSDDVRSAVNSLMDAPVVKGGTISGDDLLFIVTIFDTAMCRGPWEQKSKAEQERWGIEFRNALQTLYGLMESGPYHPRAWGFPVTEAALARAAEAMGLSLPEDDNARERAIAGLYYSTRFIGWTIADALKEYQKVTEEFAAPDQLLAKPKDSDAARTYFLKDVQRARPQLSANTVADVANALFPRETSLDVRTVRRHRPKKKTGG